MKYRKKPVMPVIIEAIQLPPAGDEDLDAFFDWAENNGFENFTSGRDETMEIETLEGTMCAEPGDWIIKGVKGEFYPCKPDIFALTYEPAEAQPASPAPQSKLDALIAAMSAMEGEELPYGQAMLLSEIHRQLKQTALASATPKRGSV